MILNEQADPAGGGMRQYEGAVPRGQSRGSAESNRGLPGVMAGLLTTPAPLCRYVLLRVIAAHCPTVLTILRSVRSSSKVLRTVYDSGQRLDTQLHPTPPSAPSDANQTLYSTFQGLRLLSGSDLCSFGGGLPRPQNMPAHAHK
jgi:hypothetical protein